MPLLEEIRQIPKDPGYIGTKATTNWPAVVLSHLKTCPKGNTVPGIVEALDIHTAMPLDDRTNIAIEALDYLESLGLVLCAGESWHAKKVRL